MKGERRSKCSLLDCSTANNHVDMGFLLLPPTLTVIRCCLHERYPAGPSTPLSQAVRACMFIGSLAFMFYLVLLFQIHPRREECCALRKECVHKSTKATTTRCVLIVVALLSALYNVWGYANLSNKAMSTGMRALIIGANVCFVIVISCLFAHSFK